MISLNEGSWKIHDIVRVGVALGNTAHIDTSFHLEISLISPFFRPWVLDYPVVNSVFSTISNSQNSVINFFWLGSTVLRSINPWGVSWESSDDLESDRDGSVIVEMISQFNFISLSDVNRSSSNGDAWLGSRELASSINSGVWISRFRLNTTSTWNVFECVRWETTIASEVVISSCTVN